MGDQSDIARLLAEVYGGDPRATYRDPLAAYSKEAFAANPWALPPQERPASGEIRNPTPRPSDRFTPVHEALSPTMGAYGVGQLLAETYGKVKDADYTGALQAAAPLTFAAVPIPGAKLPRVQNPIKAYHGSPHDFDKFDLSKIGTGEGAQAYGHGLYFAEKEGVAKIYRDQLAGGELKIGGEPVRPGSPYWNDASELANIHHGDINAMIADLRQTPGYDWMGSGKKSQRELRLEEMKAKGVEYTPNGKMYEVALHASPEQFLDWDKPLAAQAPQMRDATVGAAVKALEHHPVAGQSPQSLKRMQDFYREMYQENIDKPLGSGLFDLGNTPHGAQQRAIADNLREAGIPGIKYLDQGSRGAGQGTSNYVVFDPRIVQILKKYGIAGPVAASILSQYEGEPQPNAIVKAD